MSSHLVNVFESGEPFSVYRERVLALGGLVSEMLRDSEATLAETTLDLSAFTALSKPIRALILSEDWCGDCTDNLPILDRIARVTGTLDHKIVARDSHLDIADQHLKYGKFRAIPLVLFLTEAGEVGGVFIERPESVTELRNQKRAEVHALHPEFGGPEGYAALPDDLRDQLSGLLSEARESTRPFAIQEAVRAFGEQAQLANS